MTDWLTAGQIEALNAERDELRVLRDTAQQRTAEIDRAIVASGESKVRAMREAAEWADGQRG